jgi:3-deoxy-D-manno-octulosonic-acid transferase
MRAGAWFWTSWLYGTVVVLSTALYYLLSPLRKGRQEGGWAWFRRRMAGADPRVDGNGRVVWLHGVSAGEAKVASLIASELKRTDPSLTCVLTTSTATGLAFLEREMTGDRIGVMPPDVPHLQARLIASIRPVVAVLCESDFWPGNFAALGRAGVPVVIANARMSDRSLRRYRSMPWLVNSTFAGAATILTQDAEMAGRFASCVAGRRKVLASGNLKLASPQRRAVADGPRDAITFASMHGSEIALLAGPLLSLAAALPDCRIFVAPRHPGAEFAADLESHLPGAFHKTAADETLPDRPGIYLVNRMGVLPELYARSQIAVVCGSFVPIGGHDVAEPLHYGAVSMFGPHFFRQHSLVDELGRASVAKAVDVSNLVQVIGALMADEEQRSSRLAAFEELTRRAADGLTQTVAAIRAAAHLHSDGPSAR